MDKGLPQYIESADLSFGLGNDMCCLYSFEYDIVQQPAIRNLACSNWSNTRRDSPLDSNNARAFTCLDFE